MEALEKYDSAPHNNCDEEGIIISIEGIYVDIDNAGTWLNIFSTS